MRSAPDIATGGPEVRKDDAPGLGAKDMPDDETYNQVVKVHNGLGHPYNRTLSRVLKDAGAREEMRKAALHLKRRACLRTRRPELEPVA
eukprot:5052015-Pyramimonas_sp.AAC.1